ncbi:MAG: hypothetical protein M0P31_04645 [Solirubrobacteraceae bacterium]|nr:hypothetical protein [Solirubrobacteraceae bacterium]
MGSRHPREPRGSGDAPLWLRRLRWRLRGDAAPLTFVVTAVAGAVLLKLLPPVGDGGVRGGWGGALALAVGAATVVVVVVGGAGAAALRRRDPSLPRPVARDRAATVGLVVGLAVLAVAGVAHRPAVLERRAEVDRVAAATRALARERAPSSARAHLDDVDVRRWAHGLFRACIPVGRPDRAWCAVVRVEADGMRAREDGDVRPNAAVEGPGG